jgi:hypothetical protein
MSALKQTTVSYGVLRKHCLDAIRKWPGCEAVAAVQLVRTTNSPSGFSLKITLYGQADKKSADKAVAFVERQLGREFKFVGLGGSLTPLCGKSLPWDRRGVPVSSSSLQLAATRLATPGTQLGHRLFILQDTIG